MAFRDMYTQFYPPKPKFTEKDVTSQSGRVFIVTGGSMGVGFELCKMLYDTGATVYLTSRSKARGEEAMKLITDGSKSTTTGILNLLLLDLNDLVSVQEAAAEFARQETRLDVLWNNAGTGTYLIQPSETTAQGHEAMVGRHCIAPLLFTQLLLPQLRAAVAAQKAPGSVRVVWTSSIAGDHGAAGYQEGGIDLDLLGKVSPDRTLNYAVSKVGNWYLAREMARRYGSEGILSLVLNPGNIDTHSYTDAPAAVVFFMKLLVLKPAKLGGYTELFAGLSPDVKPEHGGKFVMPWGRFRRDEDCPRQDVIKAMKPEEEGGPGKPKKFWDWCEQQARDFM